MIRTISIKNYKSISELELELGRVNVLIGANGSGKSNILEAITFGSAAAANKLDNEFLANRGIRVTDHRLMRCGFDEANLDQPIKITFVGQDDSEYDASLLHDDAAYSGWRPTVIDPSRFEDLIREAMLVRSGRREELQLDFLRALAPLAQYLPGNHARDVLRDFLAYTPQLPTLRELRQDSSIEPLGIHGEGLFRLLQVLQSQERLDQVKRAVEVIDWFEDLQLIGNGASGGRRITIVDQYIDPEISGLDHLSVNEGFLFFLFYAALLISADTPKFFAVDNIGESLNPKLCTHLTQAITRLAQENDKQVILTTHNPAILDGLTLSDDEQRLMVVYRNADGHTRVRRVSPSPDADKQSVPLSEAFLRGYLGGLPTNF